MNKNSSKRIKNLLFISLLVIFISLSSFFVNSYIQLNTYDISKDYSALINTDVDICKCGSYSESITIYNTGTYPTIFYLESNKPNLLNFPDQGYKITNSGELNIPFIINADCNLKETNIVLTITSSFNVVKNYNINLNPKNCINLGSNIEQDKFIIEPNEKINYELTVKNVGEFYDVFYYDFGEYDDYAISKYRTVGLSPGQTGTFNISLILPYDMIGNYSIPINVYSDNAQIGLTFNSNITILKDYNYSINFGKNLFACLEDPTAFKLVINNEEFFENTFYIDVIEPDFIKLDSNKVVIPGNSSKEIIFESNHKENNKGNNNIIFEVTSELGNIKKNISSELNLDYCYYLDFESDYNYYNFKNYPEDITFKIKNWGAMEHNVFLSLISNIDNLSLDKTFFNLKSGDTEEITIDTSKKIFNDEDNRYKIKIIALINGTDYEFNKFFSIDFLSTKTIYKPIIDPSNIKITFYDNKSYFIVKNVGYENVYYNFSINPYDIENSSWIHFNYSNNVFLETGEEYIIPIYFDQNIHKALVDDYVFNIKLVPQNSDIDITYNYDLTIKLRDKSIFYYVGLWIYNNPLLVSLIVFFLLLILLLLYLLLSRPTTKKQGENRKKTRNKIVKGYLFLILLFLILLLVFCPLKSMYPTLELNDSDEINYIMYEGSKLNINMSDYFIDPDNDILTYYDYINYTSCCNDSKFVNITFNDNIATMISSKDYSGIVPIRFYASDSKYYTGSDIFLLKVVEKPKYSFMDIIDFYFCYVIWLAISLFLLIFIIFICIWANKKSKNQIKYDKRNKSKV